MRTHKPNLNVHKNLGFIEGRGVRRGCCENKTNQNFQKYINNRKANLPHPPKKKKARRVQERKRCVAINESKIMNQLCNES